MDLQALWLTIRLANARSTGTADSRFARRLLGSPTPLARWKFLVEAVVALPWCSPLQCLALPSYCARPSQPLGRWWQAVTGHTLVFTLKAFSGIHSLQPAFCRAAFRSIFRVRWIAGCCGVGNTGCSPGRAFARIILPLSVTGLVTGVALSFAHTLGEFGWC